MAERKKQYIPLQGDAALRGVQSRRIALQVLIQVHGGAYSNNALPEALKSCQLSKRDKAFVTLLVQGVTRNTSLLDDVIKRFSKNAIETLPPALLNTLRLAFFQLKFLKETPASAVLNTSASIAKIVGHKGMASYTTAVLHSYLRSAEAKLEAESDTADGAPETGEAGEEPNTPAELSRKYTIPEWLVERWIKNFGQDEALSLLKFSTSLPRIVLRANEINITPEGLGIILDNADIKYEVSPLVPSCLVLDPHGRGRGSPSGIPGYNEGMFSIQDDTAALVAKVVEPKPGELIIDLCAAPGGKSLYLGELMENKGRIIAVDTRANRLELLKTNRRRLGITNIEVMEADGTTLEFEPQVDRILIDAPCSGTGVLNRRSDLRHRRKPEDIASLATLQYELLANAQRLLKPGGVLVYATCAVEPEENEHVIDKFVANHPDFRFDDLTPYFPQELIEQHDLSYRLRTGKIQILPSMSNLSGFFIARLIKVEKAMT
ncbi:MAG: 16S rRNA (cytosine(967)-C(5))-methyltransferase RsmB [Candidatus Melainabacteria bacterium]|nr:16S rRNA (cytosine(967)-C(5))-methyltransferase RsmB [Candidatus Melainabacteria bacterium]